LPVKTDAEEAVAWKIWSLSTWVDNLVDQPEDEELLLSPSKKLDVAETINTDVFIIGAGSS
jgi:hypothetical protein